MSEAATTLQPFSRPQMAKLVADDIPEGWFVNLGIGIPTAVADHVPLDREVIFHSENGVLGMGPAPPKEKIDPWLVNAGKQHVTLRTAWVAPTVGCWPVGGDIAPTARPSRKRSRSTRRSSPVA